MKVQVYQGHTLIETEIGGRDYVLVVPGEISAYIHDSVDPFRRAQEWVENYWKKVEEE